MSSNERILAKAREELDRLLRFVNHEHDGFGTVKVELTIQSGKLVTCKTGCEQTHK